MLVEVSLQSHSYVAQHGCLIGDIRLRNHAQNDQPGIAYRPLLFARFCNERGHIKFDGIQPLVKGGYQLLPEYHHVRLMVLCERRNGQIET